MTTTLKNPPATPDYHWPPLLTNRRAAPRLARKFPTSHGVAVDMSVTGIRLETPTPLAVGAPLQLRLQPGVSVPATVVWSSDGEAGLAFDTHFVGLPAWLRA